MTSKIVLLLVIVFAFTLRVYNLSGNPPALNWDESSLGFNAFSISETLRDEHGEFLPLTRFIAFGDYKPPGYIYVDALFVKLFGLSEFSIRFPSALAGTLLVFGTFLLLRELKFGSKTALTGCFVLAISPWALQFSRGAFEANLATLFTALGVLFYLKLLRGKSPLFNIVFASVFFAASMYTFNSHRIFTPLLIGVLVLIHVYKFKLASLKRIIPFAMVFLVLVSPLVPYFLSREGKLRFQEVAWVNDLAPLETANERLVRDNNSLDSKVINNRRVVYGHQFLKHYFDHLQSNFLFLSGDVNPRLGIQTVGLFYWLELPLILFGIFYLIKKRNYASFLLFAWVLLAPIPASFARETPHALRILNAVPAPQIILALGLINLIKRIKVLIPVFAVCYALFAWFYLHDYYVHYPIKYAMSWQYGYKEMITYVNSIKKEYKGITISETYGRPYIYALLYSSYSPEKYWQTRNADRDWFGFWYVHSFDKYYFGEKAGSGKWLYVRGPEKLPDKARLLKTINAPDGQVVFQIFDNQ